jgi:protein phosphatase
MDQVARADYTAAGASVTGRVRSMNEDSFAFHLGEPPGTGDFVVCDGMGGAAAGEIASQLATQTMLQAMKAEPMSTVAMRHAVGAANSSVHTQAKEIRALHGMGTTLVALAVRGWRGWLAHVGDSRCYRLRDGKFLQLTQDHSLVEEQVRMGQMTPAQAAVSAMRNVITRAVGVDARVDPDVTEFTVHEGDLYLLASDGLTRELSDVELFRILNADRPLEDSCSELIRLANQAGGNDNITCLLVAASQTMNEDQAT